MIVVVDASVAAMWFLPDANSQNAARLLDPGYDLAAPDLLSMEVASALLKALRRREISAGEAFEALEVLSAAGLRLFPADDYVDRAFQVTRRHGGSLYDGIYVALAQSLGAPVVTSDTRLAATATAAGIRAIMISEGPPRPKRGSHRGPD